MNNFVVVGSLRSEKAALNRLIGQLTEQRHAKIMRDDHAVTSHTAPSLLEELRAAVAVGGESTGMGAAAPGSRLPIATNATDALAVVEERVLRMQLQASRAGGVPIESRLQLLQSIVLGWSDAADVAWACEQLRGLVDLIEGTLSPVRRITIRRPCPVCGAESVATVDELGETVRQPALVADDRTGAECRACGRMWPPAMLAILAATLDAGDEGGDAAPVEAASSE